MFASRQETIAIDSRTVFVLFTQQLQWSSGSFLASYIATFGQNLLR
jgi:hypothetical protein